MFKHLLQKQKVLQKCYRSLQKTNCKEKNVNKINFQYLYKTNTIKRGNEKRAKCKLLHIQTLHRTLHQRVYWGLMGLCSLSLCSPSVHFLSAHFLLTFFLFIFLSVHFSLHSLSVHFLLLFTIELMNCKPL